MGTNPLVSAKAEKKKYKLLIKIMGLLIEYASVCVSGPLSFPLLFGTLKEDENCECELQWVRVLTCII
jgi:hypothetical protein